MTGLSPYVIPIFIAHQGCPHRCIFCNQALITAGAPRLPDENQFNHQVARFLGHGRPDGRRVEIAFFGGNFLGLEKNQVRRLLGWADKWIEKGKVDGIRFSTRPDTIDVQSLNTVARFPVHTIELGVQSMNDDVLKAAARGHDAAATTKAAALIKGRMPGCRLGVQLMIGLPRDSETRAVETASRVVRLEPDFVRIYPTLVLNQSPLAELYHRGKYHPLSLARAVNLCARLYCIFKSRDISVIRMGLQATGELLRPGTVIDGPFHTAFGQLVISKICLDTVVKALAGPLARSGLKTLAAGPSLVSSLRGQRNCNLARFKALAGNFSGTIAIDPGLGPDQIMINGRRFSLCLK